MSGRILHGCRHIFGPRQLSLYPLAKNLPLINKLTKATAFNESGAYDGDGKSTASILQNEYGSEINLIRGFSPVGFRLSNRAFVYGSIIIFPTSTFAWNVSKSADINMESLILFDLILPKVKMLVIGYGDIGDKYDASIPMLLKKKGISCEMLPTSHATTTYNYLATDGLHVAGVFIPPKNVLVRPKDNQDNYMKFMQNIERKDTDKDERDILQQMGKYKKSQENRLRPKGTPDEVKE